MKKSSATLVALVLVLTFLFSACTMTPIPATGNTTGTTTPATDPTTPTTDPTTDSHNCENGRHVYEATLTVEPTCTQKGEMTYRCLYCDVTPRVEKVDALGHNYVFPGTRTEGTCQAEGHTDVTCAVCGDSKSIVDASVGAHHFEEGVCTVCGKTVDETVVSSDPYYDGEHIMPDRYNTGAGSYLYADHTMTRGADITSDVTVSDGVTISASGEGSKRTYTITVDYGRLGEGTKKVVISDYDFSDGTVSYKFNNLKGNYVYTEDYGTDLGDGLWSDPTGGRFTVKLVNCSLKSAGLPRSEAGNWSDGGLVCFYFENCTLSTVSQCSNAVFDRCYVGDHDQDDIDGFNPMQNVFIYNTFVDNLAAVNYYGGEGHTDATQIYGYKGIVAKNIHHYNYRCEMPVVYYTGSISYVNSCLMVSLDFNDAYDISFAHCFINGAGCPIMINDHPHMGGGSYYGENNGNYNMFNILYKDILHGTGSVYDEFNSNTGIKSQTTWNESNYQSNPDYKADTRTDAEKRADYISTVTLDNWNNAVGALLVGSVWEKDGTAHFSVTNDTYRERQITILTSNGSTYHYIIGRHLRHVDFKEDMARAELPVDIDVTIPETADWYVCYDSTDGDFTQIRFVNKTDATVKVSLDQMKQDWTPAPMTYVFTAEGTGVWKAVETEKDSAGNYIAEIAFNRFKETGGFYIKNTDFTYRLTSDGTLTVSGTGSMPSLAQAQLENCDFYPMLSKVKKLVIAPGVTNVASNFCAGMYNLEEVVLASTVTSIGSRAFYGCNSLRSVTLPVGLSAINAGAFENCTSLKTVVIPENVTTLGARAFAGCISLESAVVLSASVTKVLGQTFRGDVRLQTVTLRESVASVEPLAFYGCSALETIRYTGTADGWNAVKCNLKTNPTLEGMTPVLASADDVLAENAAAVNRTVRKTPTFSTTKLPSATGASAQSIQKFFEAGCEAGITKGGRELPAYIADRIKYGYKAAFVFQPNQNPGKVCDGTSFDFGFTTDSDGEVTIKWMKGAKIVGFNENGPKDPGCYVAVITVSGTENYEPIEIHQMFFMFTLAE